MGSSVDSDLDVDITVLNTNVLAGREIKERRRL